MRWRDLRQSGNVEDRRGMGGRGLAVGGIGSVIVLIIAFFLGIDPRKLLNSGGDAGPPGPGTNATRSVNPEEEELRQFTSAVLGSTEDIWSDIFRQQGRQYVEPKLAVFSDRVQSACGLSSAAVGPFYCPGDQKVYLDLSFFRELQTRFRAPGDFAQAYVIAHEVGHHIQNLLGTMDRVNQLQARGGEREANQLSVRLELQADFYAGVWAHYAQRRGILEPGDVEEALRAATAIGDDQLQKEGQGYVVPDSFTHGTSEQRMRWFRKGLETGDIRQGDTFNIRSP
ncbi:MAG TPA: neutral zinc metallopeptidase [Pyrinomonadaceae bacterium]|nr:neutral zinc metallopeptidase [Pyrinomonadaceae bacterium]